jgi:hypothetical protein
MLTIFIVSPRFGWRWLDLFVRSQMDGGRMAGDSNHWESTLHHTGQKTIAMA